MSGVIEISLSALAANYRRLSRDAAAAVAAVVKADAYGLGAQRVVACLRQQGCQEFFVATLAEGLALRRAHPEVRIYVLEGVRESTISPLLAADLTPVLNSAEQLQIWSTTGARSDAAVHVDTGMQRLGLPYAQANALLAQYQVLPSLLLTHFARADEVGHQTLALQLSRLQAVVAAQRLRQPTLRTSVSNSAALLQGLGPEDLGRAGIGLYGGNPLSGPLNPMQTVVRMYAPVLQIRDVPEGVAVGYGGTHVTPQGTRLAVIGVGYADGVPRALSNCGQFWLGGRYCPIVGRVSMDLTVVEIGDAALEAGELAEVMGDHVRVDDMARQANTIAYEIFTGLGRRMPRKYLD